MPGRLDHWQAGALLGNETEIELDREAWPII